MYHKIDDVRWYADSDGEWVCFRTNDAKYIVELCESGKQYDFDVREHRVKRSLDANAYCWTLIGKLAIEMGINAEDLYRNYIREVGVYEMIPVRSDRLKAWEDIWCNGHTGRMIIDRGACRTIEGYHAVASYLGSSDYDTKQMSRLIDNIVQDCKACGIETLTPNELDALKSRWGEVYGDR